MKLYQIDAFTDAPFCGNPAGVCMLEDPKPDQWMLGVAREMNLSETAFLLKQESRFKLRWFTPKLEVSLCGHATLASAHMLWEEKLLRETEKAVFDTRSGVLTACKNGSLIELDFPARDVQPAADNKILNDALGVAPVFTGLFPTPDGPLYLLQVQSDSIVMGLVPDYQGVVSSNARAVIVTSVSSNESYDFVSRFFAPAVGINEDPVTGSAHCYLTPYWAKILHRNELTGYQASERSGAVACKWINDRVWLGGKAVTIFRAELRV